MICFTIPKKLLRLVLTALHMNFNLPDPDYIFQNGDTYEIVIKRPAPAVVEAIDLWIEKAIIANGEKIKKEEHLISSARDLVKAIQMELNTASLNSFPQIFYCMQNLDSILWKSK